MPPMFPGNARGGPRSVAIETGRRLSGKECPNCNWPIENPKAPVMRTPGAGTFTCEHCGWSMSAPRHDGSGAGDIVPRPGRPA